MKTTRLVATALLGLTLLGGAAQAEPSAALRGRIAFMRCAACHSLGAGEPHKVGPNLRGVIGGSAAQAAGYNYTPALRQSDLRWDDATLKRWIRDPAALVPGTSMAYSNSLGEADIEALLVFLKSAGH
ncbi:MAG: c-type cytochrome [Ideonella sp.]|nr:c-type cytochrome [Ideonella sp.]MBP8100329.1 c-type cytochrome [Burkholderiaceae bacterium]